MGRRGLVSALNRDITGNGFHPLPLVRVRSRPFPVGRTRFKPTEKVYSQKRHRSFDFNIKSFHCLLPSSDIRNSGLTSHFITREKYIISYRGCVFRPTFRQRGPAFSTNSRSEPATATVGTVGRDASNSHHHSRHERQSCHRLRPRLCTAL